MALSLSDLLRRMLEMGGSDLHITTNSPPQIRVHGHLVPLDLPQLTPAETKQLAYSVMTDSQKNRFEENLELDFSFGLKGLARFRANIFNQRGASSSVFRLIPFEIKSFHQLGLPAVVSKLCDKPRGLVLVTGPTGSGKSTTLAAMIDKINTERHEHILTIEDPIEFVHMNKNCVVNQRELHSDTKSFSGALRAALREDPDVVLIGEIRDHETAQIAVQASLTGHLVFSTLHTNDAPGALNRLVDMGVEPYLVASSLEGVLAQRLVRLLCPKCKVPDHSSTTALMKERNKIPENVTVYKGVGCEECRNTGFFGRHAIFEWMAMTNEVRTLLLRNADTGTIRDVAIEQGMTALSEDGWRLIGEGLSTPEEVMRVTKDQSLTLTTKKKHEDPLIEPAKPDASTDGTAMFTRANATVSV